MARSFASASSQYLETDSPPFTGLPFTMSQWFNVTRTNASDGNFFLGDSGTVDNRFWASARSNGNWGIASSAPGGGSGVSDAGAYSANTWHNGVGVYRTTSDREAFLDGVGGAGNTDNQIPAGVDRLSIGRFGDSTPGLYVDGLIAFFALWDVALTDAEVASIAAGYDPPFIRPESLVFYMDMLGDGDNDRIGGLHLTPFNGPTLGPSPPIISQSSPRVFAAPVRENAALMGANF